jgi:PAS domain-containing protein
MNTIVVEHNLQTWNIISMAEIALSFFGIFISLTSKKGTFFKIKLLFVYLLLMFYGLSSIYMFVEPDTIEVIYIIFIYSLVLLNYRASKEQEGRFTKVYNWLNSVVDVAPDMIWIKDKGNRFLYTNKIIRKELLLTDDYKYPIGKNGVDIALDIRKRGIEYTAGEVCGKSDDITMNKEKPCMFLEDFVIDGKEMFLLVHKKPIYENGKIVGTVGVGRIVTDIVNEHKEILCAYKAKNWKRFERLLEEHVNKYYFSFNNDSKLIDVKKGLT